MPRSSSGLLIGIALVVLVGSFVVLRLLPRLRVADAGAVTGREEAFEPAIAPSQSPDLVSVDAGSSRVAVDDDKPPSTSSVAPPQSVPDTEAQIKRRNLRETLAQFDGTELENPHWPGFSRQQLAPILVMSSVGVVMDALGTSTIVPQGHSRDILESGRFDFAFMFGNRQYRFRRGDFPIYEEYRAMALAESARESAVQAAQLEPPYPPPSAVRSPGASFPEDYLERVSQFAHSALALGQ